MQKISRGLLTVLFYSTIFGHLQDSGRAEVAGGPDVTIEFNVWPLPQHQSGSDYPLISYNRSNESSYSPLVNYLRSSLHDYKTLDSVPGRRDNIVVCSFHMPPQNGRVCDIDVGQWALCTEENEFNYRTNSPCIFLRLNTPHGWVPEFYNDPNTLPEGMPSDLKAHIVSIDSQRLNTVWISCEGDNSVDEENMGPIQYFPIRGIPGYQLLNNDVQGYLSPLVAVYFERPKLGSLINIRCKAWARNINPNGDALEGAKFGLLIE